jgi:hypothetical protein
MFEFLTGRKATPEEIAEAKQTLAKRSAVDDRR